MSVSPCRGPHAHHAVITCAHKVRAALHPRYAVDAAVQGLTLVHVSAQLCAFTGLHVSTDRSDVRTFVGYVRRFHLNSDAKTSQVEPRNGRLLWFL